MHGQRGIWVYSAIILERGRTRGLKLCNYQKMHSYFLISQFSTISKLNMPWPCFWLNLCFMCMSVWCFQLYASEVTWYACWLRPDLFSASLLFEVDVVHVLLLNQICIRCTSVLSFATFIDPVFCSLKWYPGCPLDLFSPQRSPVRNLGPGGGSRQLGLMMRGGDLRPGVPTLLPHTHTYPRPYVTARWQ